FNFALFFVSSRRRHTRFSRDWSSDVCSSDLKPVAISPNPVVTTPVPVTRHPVNIFLHLHRRLRLFLWRRQGFGRLHHGRRVRRSTRVICCCLGCIACYWQNNSSYKK